MRPRRTWRRIVALRLPLAGEAAARHAGTPGCPRSCRHARATSDTLSHAACSFPYPASAASEADGEEFELEMMKALREVNVDNNVVGWYQSTYLGSYCTRDTILHQFEFQENLPNCVVLIYDGVRTAQGQLALKALRLTDSFCDAFRAKRITAEKCVGWQELVVCGGAVQLAAWLATRTRWLVRCVCSRQQCSANTRPSPPTPRPASRSLSSLSPSAIFEELPIRFRNSALAQALLLDIAGGAGSPLAASAALARAGERGGVSAAVPMVGSVSAASTIVPGAEVDVDFARLNLTTAPFLEKVRRRRAAVARGRTRVRTGYGDLYGCWHGRRGAPLCCLLVGAIRAVTCRRGVPTALEYSVARPPPGPSSVRTRNRARTGCIAPSTAFAHPLLNFNIAPSAAP